MLPVHRFAGDFLPARKRGRRQVPRHPSGQHHALPADGGGTERTGHLPEHDPPFDRYGARRRHHRRPGPGVRKGLTETIHIQMKLAGSPPQETRPVYKTNLTNRQE